MSINKFNSEGYYDPTAFEAMSAVVCMIISICLLTRVSP